MKIPVSSFKNFGLVKSTSKQTALSGDTEAIIHTTYMDSDGLMKVNVRNDLNFAASQLTSLEDDDKILVNYDNSNLSNYITYGSLKS